MVAIRRLYRSYRTYVDWTVIVIAIIAILVLGAIGFQKNLAVTDAGRSYSRATLFYLALQMFLLNSGAVAEPVGWELETARLLAVLAFFAAVLKTAVAVFWRRVDEWRASWARGHTVVCGGEATGLLMAAERLAAGEQVVLIDDVPDRDLVELRDLGALALVGDATNSATLAKAGVRDAARVMIAVGDDATNLQVAAATGQLCRDPRRAPPTVIDVHCVDTRMFELLEPVSGLGLVREPAGVEYRRFDPLFDGARALLDAHPLDREPIAACSPLVVQLVLFGFTRESECLLLQTARMGHYANGIRPKVRIVAPDAAASERRLRFRFPAIDNILDLEFVASELEDPRTLTRVDGWLHEPRMLSTVAISPRDADDSLPIAMSLSPYIADSGVPVFVRLSHRPDLARLLAERSGAPGSWHVFGELTRAGIANFVIQAGQDRQARAIHDDYVRRRVERGDKPADYPAMRPWEQLSESYRESNRHQADHIPVKLRAAGCVIAASDDPRPPAIWTADEVELLAAMEHARWNANRWLDGWRLGPRNDARKTHPKLVPWAELDEPTRQYDRGAVRQIPELVGLLGRKAVRAAASDRQVARTDSC
jgi:hypothetical protein